MSRVWKIFWDLLAVGVGLYVGIRVFIWSWNMIPFALGILINVIIASTLGYWSFLLVHAIELGVAIGLSKVFGIDTLGLLHPETQDERADRLAQQMVEGLNRDVLERGRVAEKLHQSETTLSSNKPNQDLSELADHTARKMVEGLRRSTTHRQELEEHSACTMNKMVEGLNRHVLEEEHGENK